ncbi:MAG: carbohydrate-binding protein [Pseudomonadota bacterium]
MLGILTALLSTASIAAIAVGISSNEDDEDQTSGSVGEPGEAPGEEAGEQPPAADAPAPEEPTFEEAPVAPTSPVVSAPVPQPAPVAPPAAVQTPHPGPAAPLLGSAALTIDASNYDEGGQGVAYNDTPGIAGYSNGGRAGSDVEQTASGDIGWVDDGEWLEYTVEVSEAGNYTLEMLLSGQFDGRIATVEVFREGETTAYASTGAIDNPATGSWDAFETRAADDALALEAGTQTFRVTFNGGTQDFRSFTLTPEGAAPAPVVVEEPMTPPMAEEPADDEPTVEEPGDDEPMAEEPGDDEPMVEEPGDDEPMAEEPGDDEPMAEEPGDDEPMAEEPAPAAPPAPVQTPYSGEAPRLDGAAALTVDASYYDEGGQGVAYNDAAGLQGGNDGGRTGSDVEQSANGDIGWVEDGDWLEYTIDVAEAGDYALDMMLSTRTGVGLTVTVEAFRPGETEAYASSGPIANPATGDWANFETRSADDMMTLEAGPQVFRVTLNGGAQDFQSFTLTPEALVETPVVEEPGDDEPMAEEPGDDEPIVVEPLGPRPSVDYNVNSQQSLSIDGGRVTTLEVGNGDPIWGIEILEQPDHGTVSVNPDNTLAIVMSNSSHSGSIDFDYRIIYEDNYTETVSASAQVSELGQEAGWGTSISHYMLETDEEGELVLEHGDNHRDVYVTGDGDALSLRDIAALENVSVSTITGSWLAAHPEYGSNPDMALEQDAGLLLWEELAGQGAEPSSNWLHLERGYTYDEITSGKLMPRGIEGEDPLHPTVITSYGTGAKPIIPHNQYLGNETFGNLVVQDMHFTEEVLLVGPNSATGNVIFDNITATGLAELAIINVDSVTVRNSTFDDIGADDPLYGNNWEPHDERISGLYSSGGEGLLIEGNDFARIGWDEGYDPQGNGNDPQPPSMFSHNVYVNYNTTDMTFRDNISAQAASFGGQLRSGGYIEDNLFLDNNGALKFRGGDYNGAGPVGNYTFVSSNVVTSAGYNDADQIGAVSLGIHNIAEDTTLVNNVVTHLADPDNPSELNEKWWNNGAVDNDKTAYYDDTIVYNWHSGRDASRGQEDNLNQNIEGLDTDALDEATAQNLAKELLNDPSADIDDLVDWILENDVSADELNAYFQEPFGVLPPQRTTAEELRFVPNELGDGVRWDNRINWDTEDLPGSADGDSVDLGGNHVIYGGTTRLNELDLGEGGRLQINHGYLEVEGALKTGTQGGRIEIDEAGQFITNAYSDTDGLDLDVNGGRFANEGSFSGLADITVSGNAQAILAGDDAAMTLGAGSTLNIRGDDARVGFDGDDGGTAVLNLDDDATLQFTAMRESNGSRSNDLGEISEFRSGHFDSDSPDVMSGVNLGDGRLVLDLSNLQVTSGTHSLIEVDELIGTFSEVEVIGQSGSQSGQVTVDYVNDTVTLSLWSGNGSMDLHTIGEETDFNSGTELWQALTEGQGVTSDTQMSSDAMDPDEDDPALAA